MLTNKQLQCLARYRLAALHLEGRKNHNRHTLHRVCPLCGVSGCRTAWSDRIAARCGSPQPEDLLHSMLECPAYNHIREAYPTVFALHALSLPLDRLHAAFDCVDQDALVNCIWHMDLYRSHLLGIQHAQYSRIMFQPAGYIPADVALRCRADFGLRNATVFSQGIATMLCLLLLIAVYYLVSQ